MNINPKFLFASVLVSLLVMAAEIPDALPAGFLEQLPVMMKMDEAEYGAFLVFSEQEMLANKNKKEQPEEDSDEN